MFLRRQLDVRFKRLGMANKAGTVENLCTSALNTVLYFAFFICFLTELKQRCIKRKIRAKHLVSSN